MTLVNKSILITGAAQRVGRALALAAADAGANLIIHYGSSQAQALETQAAIQAKGRQAHLLQADLNDLDQTLQLSSAHPRFTPSTPWSTTPPFSSH
jgi:3-oxoacyl-[acyl-carrier protein] reductase